MRDGLASFDDPNWLVGRNAQRVSALQGAAGMNTISLELEAVLAVQELSGFTLAELQAEHSMYVRFWHTAQKPKEIFEIEKTIVALDVEVKNHPDNAVAQVGAQELK
jgi:hypothetical protein